MDQAKKDIATITVFLQRFEKFRLPRALALKDKVDRGELLDELDKAFLDKVFSDARQVGPLVSRHPQYHELIGRMTDLYRQITEKAVQNEKVA